METFMLSSIASYSNIYIAGPSSTGKTILCNKILEFFNTSPKIILCKTQHDEYKNQINVKYIESFEQLELYNNQEFVHVIDDYDLDLLNTDELKGTLIWISQSIGKIKPDYLMVPIMYSDNYLKYYYNKIKQMSDLSFEQYKELNTEINDRYSFMVFDKNNHVYKYKVDIHDNLYSIMDIHKEIHDDIEKNIKYIDMTNDTSTYESLYPNYGNLLLLESSDEHDEVEMEYEEEPDEYSDNYCDNLYYI